MQNKRHTHYKAIRYLIQSFLRNEIQSSEEEKDVLWQKICKEVDYKTNHHRKLAHIRFTIIGVAASIAILFLISPWIFTKKSTQKDIEDVAADFLSTSIIDKDTEQPLLIISPDQIVPLQDNTQVEYSTEGKVSLKSEDEVINQLENSKEKTTVYNQLIVPKGKHTRLKLCDGSELHINSGTKVIYPSAFTENRREIYVDGEIFIDVQTDKKRPFYVKTSSFEISVLGTAFNVCAYSKITSAEVALLRGKIKIEDKSGKSMNLAPNQLAHIENKQLTHKQTVNAEDYIYWTKGLLRLHGEPLSYLLPKLEQYYGAVITCDEAVKKFDIHGFLDINCTLAEVLDRIALTASIRIEATDIGYHIHAKNK